MKVTRRCWLASARVAISWTAEATEAPPASAYRRRSVRPCTLTSSAALIVPLFSCPCAAVAPVATPAWPTWPALALISVTTRAATGSGATTAIGMLCG